MRGIDASNNNKHSVGRLETVVSYMTLSKLNSALVMQMDYCIVKLNQKNYHLCKPMGRNILPKYKTSAKFRLDTCCNDVIFEMSSPIFNAQRVSDKL